FAGSSSRSRTCATAAFAGAGARTLTPARSRWSRSARSRRSPSACTMPGPRAMEESDPVVDPRIFRLVVEQARDYAVFVLHPDGRIMTWSVGAERIKGYRADEIVGRHFSVFYPEEAVQRGWPDYELKMAAS